ncbi:MAG TPA: HAMP domain-containing sensor histidine kinase [Paracoccaceae bacterium]|nr:HAMP domain-containing sensor histidine kinase [Paracoccaceae bacterium]
MFFNTLSGRFLVLTVIFVMVAEVLIFVPSIANFRRDYLQEKLELAQLASLALLAAPDDMIAPELADELLENAGVLNIVLRRDAVRELVLAKPIPGMIAETFDLRNSNIFMLAIDAFTCAFHGEDEYIRVIGQPVKDAGLEIEIVMSSSPLHAALQDYATNIFFLSILISAVTSSLLYFAMRSLLVRPISNVVGAMLRYQENPEDVRNIISVTAKIKELQAAETALHDLQTRLNASLRQKERLAALGSAVAKVSHDLRNILTTAQILGDRLENSKDPTVARTAPKLLGSLDRAINLCEQTLTFGKAEEPEPNLRKVKLSGVINDVLESERLNLSDSVTLENLVIDGIEFEADPEQLFRILTNLIRNARQAIEQTDTPGKVTISAAQSSEETVITVTDTGPGLPAKAQEHLFLPFQGGARRGGIGLGLAIAAELVRGHGGVLELARTGAEGTVFRLRFPVKK